MALITCHECDKSISNTAEACPNCGAKPKKKAGAIAWILAALAIIIIVRCTNESLERAEQVASKTPEQITHEAKEKEDSARRHYAAVAAMLAIKKAARDPDSVQWDDVLVSDDGSIVCITYRARNGFGGYTHGFMSFGDGKPSDTEASWKKRCAGKRLNNNKFSANALK